MQFATMRFADMISFRWRKGGARHSVRAAVVNPDAPVGRQRRAADWLIS
jgi:hypothetical protein